MSSISTPRWCATLQISAAIRASANKRANLEAVLDHPATQWLGFRGKPIGKPAGCRLEVAELLERVDALPVAIREPVRADYLGG